jgi:hypothetical protein
MPELRLSQNSEALAPSTRVRDIVSVPERELLSFIDTVVNLLGPGATSLLTEIWLDEPACLDCLPSPNSSEWRLVSLAASARALQTGSSKCSLLIPAFSRYRTPIASHLFDTKSIIRYVYHH